jgi:hypothetical protein
MHNAFYFACLCYNLVELPKTKPEHKYRVKQFINASCMRIEYYMCYFLETNEDYELSLRSPTWESSTTIRKGHHGQNKEGLDGSSRRNSQDRIHGANEDNGLSLGKESGFSGHL